MAWDLRASLLKKEERESARLADFDFKLRARTFRLLANALGLASSEVVPLIAIGDDPKVLDRLAHRFPDRGEELEQAFARCSVARTQLLSEEGDPSPIRLA